MKACSRGGGIRHGPSPDNPHAVRASYPESIGNRISVITDTITRFLLSFCCHVARRWSGRLVLPSRDPDRYLE